MSNIRLSVLMLNYNHGIYLEERIPSILAQLKSDDEFLLVDDGSTDNSVSIIEKFLSDSRLKFLKNPKNLGVVASVNRALQESRGIYITAIASDDLHFPNFIDRTMELLLANPEIGMACSDAATQYRDFPDKDPEKIHVDSLIKDQKEPLILPPKEAIRTFWKSRFWVPGHTAIIKRDLIVDLGGFPEQLAYLCDSFLNHAIAC